MIVSYRYHLMKPQVSGSYDQLCVVNVLLNIVLSYIAVAHANYAYHIQCVPKILKI